MAKKPKQTESIETEPTVRFTVDLPLSLHLWFSVLAALQRKSKAELVRTAIERLLQSAEQ